eukprot:9796623-Alexandrium_andersonii.AAC.1
MVCVAVFAFVANARVGVSPEARAACQNTCPRKRRRCPAHLASPTLDVLGIGSDACSLLPPMAW